MPHGSTPRVFPESAARCRTVLSWVKPDNSGSGSVHPVANGRTILGGSHSCDRPGSTLYLDLGLVPFAVVHPRGLVRRSGDVDPASSCPRQLGTPEPFTPRINAIPAIVRANQDSGWEGARKKSSRIGTYSERKSNEATAIRRFLVSVQTIKFGFKSTGRERLLLSRDRQTA